MNIKSVCKFSEDMDLPSCMATQKILTIAKDVGFTGKMVISFDVIHPSNVVAFDNDKTMVRINVNIDKYDLEDVIDLIGGCLESIESFEIEILPDEWYGYGDIIIKKIVINNSLSNEECCILFLFWTPEEEGKELIRHITDAAEDIWMSFVETEIVGSVH